MSAVETTLLLAAGVFALRLSGLTLAGAAVPPAWERALGFVPVATLTALVVSALTGSGSEAPMRVLAVAGAAIVAHRTRQTWLCILIGVALYWLLRLAHGAL